MVEQFILLNSLVLTITASTENSMFPSSPKIASPTRLDYCNKIKINIQTQHTKQIFKIKRVNH